MSIETKKEVKLSKEKLEVFRTKSEFMIPNCFGGYDADDIVCRRYCFRARSNDLRAASWKVQEGLNERSSSCGGFFHNDFKFQESCEDRRRKTEIQLERIKREIEEDIKRCEYRKQERNDYFLAEESEGLGRIPVGEIKRVKDFRDFTKRILLRLKTKDNHLFVYPYGPMYDDAVGKIYEIHPGGAGPEDSEITLGYVKTITPELPERWVYPIKVIEQDMNQEGNLVLVAEIRHNKMSAKEILDIHNTDGKRVTIELYGDSAKEYVRVDDIGKL